MWTPTTRQQHSRTAHPIPDRSDRRRVARDRTALAKSVRDGPAARVADARDRQRDILRNAGGLRVAAGAERPALRMGNLCWAIPTPLEKRSEVRLIRGSPNGVHHARPQPCCPGRHRPEQVVVIHRKRWSPLTGNPGRSTSSSSGVRNSSPAVAPVPRAGTPPPRRRAA